jgi:hypothetical protein
MIRQGKGYYLAMRRRALWFLCGLLVACGLSLSQAPTVGDPPDAGIADGKVPDLPDAPAPTESGGSATLPSDPGPPSCSGTASVSPFVAHHRLPNVASNVDGNADDWSSKSMWAQIAIPFSSNEPVPPSVCAQFTAAWDMDAMHVLFRVADTVHPQAAAGADEPSVWFNDAVELFWGPEGLAADGVYRGVDHQLVVDHRSTGWLRNGAGAGLAERPYPSSDTGTLQFVAKPFAWGYTVELRVKRGAFGSQQVPFAAGNVLPFLAAFDDGKRPLGKLGRDYYLWQWDGTRSAPCSSSTPDTCCNADGGIVGRALEPACNTVFFERIEFAP